jgi:Adenylate and Guanylate cyclase catalytic domain
VVDAVRCAIEMQKGLIERNAGVLEDRRIEFRVGIHVGDVVEEADGDLMGDGVNITARLEGICKPAAICLSEDAYRQVKGRLELSVADLGPKELKNIAEPIRVYSLNLGVPAAAKAAVPKKRSPLAPLGLGLAALAILAAAGRRKRERPPDPKTPTPSISPCAAGPWRGRRNRPRKRTGRRTLSLNRRSRSIPTTPTRWRGAPARLHLRWAGLSDSALLAKEQLLQTVNRQRPKSVLVLARAAHIFRTLKPRPPDAPPRMVKLRLIKNT